MGKSVFILLCMLYRSFVFCTAQQVDMLHNMFRSSYEGNQVVKIDDAADESPNYSGAMHFRDAANEETEYTYDANGNMLTDSNKGITSIEYNVLDLPQCINIKPNVLGNSDNNVCYTYSADGTKLRSTYKKGNSQVLPYKPTPSLNIKTNGMVTPMVRLLENNYHYCSNLVYNNDRLSTILFDGGYASVDEGGGIVMHFYVKDHLGSNRLVVDGNGNIEEVNHYYPFGALMGDRCGVSRNKYKYIGKELDTMYGWNMQDHEAGWYDPVGIVWRSMDKLCEKYYDTSPYASCLNNPCRYVDYDGMKVLEKGKIVIYYDKGKLLVSPNASKYTREMFNSMMKTNTGKEMLSKMVKSPTSIHLIFNETKDTRRKTKKGLKTTYAKTQQTTKDGSSIRFNNGKYSSTTMYITFYLKNIKESMNDSDNDNYGLSLGDVLGAECSHEAVHSADSNEVHMDIRDAQKSYKGRKRTKAEYEQKANETEKKYREELKNE